MECGVCLKGRLGKPMSYDPSDDAYDQMVDELSAQLYPEDRNQAISDFTMECFQRFYVENPRVADVPLRLLSEARSLLDLNRHPSPVVVFGAAAAEVGLKLTILKPLISGFVHEPTFAGIFADLLTNRASSFDRLKKLIFQIVSVGGIDLNVFKRNVTGPLLWEELTAVQKSRDLVLHRGDMATPSEAKKAVAVASTVVEILFPTVIISMGLHLHETLICNNAECLLPEPKKPIASMSGEELADYLKECRKSRSGPPILERLTNRD
jgi:hypothetical protein